MNMLNELTASGVAVVTGAASGIGRALAVRLAGRGMGLAIADIDEAGLESTAAESAALGAAVLTRRIDVTSAAQVTTFACDVFGWTSETIRLVFANAGIHGLTSAIAPDLAVWNQVIDVNLKGAVHTGHAFLPRLIDQGQAAQFVITGSQASFLAAPGMAPYIATKHALWGLADTIRLELQALDTEVGISLVAPGRVASGITLSQAEAIRAKDGDEAASAYEAMLLPASAAAEVIIREAMRRAFWIIPSREDTLGVLRNRFDMLVNAMPAGLIGGADRAEQVGGELGHDFAG